MNKKKLLEKLQKEYKKQSLILRKKWEAYHKLEKVYNDFYDEVNKLDILMKKLEESIKLDKEIKELKNGSKNKQNNQKGELRI